MNDSVSHQISGTISGAGGSGASISLTDNSSASVIANTSGQFSLTCLKNGSYTVTPTNMGYVINPTPQALTINGFDKTGVNFATLMG
jgi:hypothetical protein